MQEWNAHWHFCYLMVTLKSPQFPMACREDSVLYVVQICCRKLQCLFSITTGVVRWSSVCAAILG